MTSKHNAHVLTWKADHLCNAHVMKHPCYRDSANCTVRSVKNLFDLSYPAAYEACKQGGRRHGCGYSWSSYLHTIKRLAKQRGLKVDRLDQWQSRRDYGKTIVTAQRRLAKGESVVFNVRGHTMSYVDGYTNDWADNRRHHIWEVWRLTS